MFASNDTTTKREGSYVNRLPNIVEKVLLWIFLQALVFMRHDCSCPCVVSLAVEFSLIRTGIIFSNGEGS